jgi:hypothetical protein
LTKHYSAKDILDASWRVSFEFEQDSERFIGYLDFPMTGLLAQRGWPKKSMGETVRFYAHRFLAHRYGDCGYGIRSIHFRLKED